MIEKLESYSDRKLMISFFLLALLLTLPMILWPNRPNKDGSSYYIPMIQAFMNFDWSHAYYPMICPGFPTVAGIIGFILSLEAYTASKFTSALFHAASFFPLFYIHKKIFNKKIATVSILLFLFCSAFLRYAGSGLLITGKTFFFLLAIFSVIRFIDEKKWRYALYVTIGITGLVLIRPEGIIMGAMIFCCFLFTEMIQIKARKRRLFFPKKSITIAFLSFLICLPWIKYQYHTIGYFVTDSRQIRAIEGLFPEKMITLLKNPSPSLLPEDAVFSDSNFDMYGHALHKIMSKSVWDRIVRPISKGFFRIYLLVAIPVIFFRISQKKWRRFESILLTIIVLHTTLMIIVLDGFWTIERYILPAMPFLLGWSAIGLLNSLNFLQKIIQQRWVNTLLILTALVLLWDSTHPIRPTFKPVKKAKEQNTVECATWLKTHAEPRLLPDWKRLVSTRVSYHSGNKPIIITALLHIGQLAEAEMILPNHYKGEYTQHDLIRLCRAKNVNFVIVDERLQKKIGFNFNKNQLNPEFFSKEFTASDENYPVWILGFKPNIKKRK